MYSFFTPYTSVYVNNELTYHLERHASKPAVHFRTARPLCFDLMLRHVNVIPSASFHLVPPAPQIEIGDFVVHWANALLPCPIVKNDKSGIAVRGNASAVFNTAKWHSSK